MLAVLHRDGPHRSAQLKPDAPDPRPAGLLFDLADVLHDASMWQRWLLRLLQRLGLHTHYRAFFRVWECEHLVDAYRGECDYWTALAGFLRSAGMTSGQIDEVRAAGRTRHSQFNDAVRPLPTVAATISRLAAAGVPLALLTNSTMKRDEVERLLDRLRLSGKFCSVFTSRDLQTVLPDAAAYQAALDALRLSPPQAAYVGHDSIELDGARAAGLTTIAVNFDCHVQADIYLDRFDQLSGLVETAPARKIAG